MSQLSHQEQTTGEGGEPPSIPVKAGQRSRAAHMIRAAISLVVVIAIFALIIPKIASYSSVWKTLTKLTSFQLLAVTGAMVFNLFTYWWQMQAAMPGLTMWQAA